MKENEYLLLLLNQMSGDITPSESALLQEWINESPDHARIAAEYRLIWDTSGSYNKTFSPNLDADFAKIQDRIRAEAPPTLRVVSFNQKLLRAAAAVAVLALAVWGYRTFNSTDSFDRVATVEQGEKQLVSLSDGTQVWLRKGSTLRYASSFAGKKDRKVLLTGEAFFEVAHDAEHPFRVALESGAYVEVLGTQFDVRQSEEATSVLVKSGKVRFSANSTTHSPVLTANQKAVFDHNASSLRITSANTLNDLSWQTGNLEFVKTPLVQVIADLEKFYGAKITLQNKTLDTCLHSALLKNQSLKNVLDGLAVTYQLTVTETAPGVYLLSGGQCK